MRGTVLPDESSALAAGNGTAWTTGRCDAAQASSYAGEWPSAAKGSAVQRPHEQELQPSAKKSVSMLGRVRMHAAVALTPQPWEVRPLHHSRPHATCTMHMQWDSMLCAMRVVRAMHKLMAAHAWVK